MNDTNDEELRTEADFLGSSEWQEIHGPSGAIRRAMTSGGDNVVEALTRTNVDIISSVKYFMEEAGQLDEIGVPTDVKDPIRVLRRQMLAGLNGGEVGEYLDAEFVNDQVEMLDGGVDIMVVIIGTMLRYFGEDVLRKAIAEVCRSNEDKVNGKHGPTLWSGEPKQSKVLKPIKQGWQGPKIREIMEEAGIIQPMPEDPFA